MMELISSCSDSLLCCLLDTLVGISTEGLLVVPVVVEPLGLNVDPHCTEKLLEES